MPSTIQMLLKVCLLAACFLMMGLVGLSCAQGEDLFKGAELEIVGESYQQAELREIHTTFGSGPLAAELRPDPSNPYDRNAVMVLIGGQHVAYLSRNDAAKWHSRIAEETQNSGHPVEISVLLRGGSALNIGVFHYRDGSH